MFQRFIPDLYVNSVVDLTPSKLRDLGIKNLLLDVDCTLKSYKEQEVPQEIRNWLQMLKNNGTGLCLISNGMGRRISKIAGSLSLPYIASAMKPSIRGCNQALSQHGFLREETAIVGDQLFSDIWAGHRAHLFTIHVKPIHPEQEPLFAQYKRPLESLIFWFYPPKYE